MYELVPPLRSELVLMRSATLKLQRAAEKAAKNYFDASAQVAIDRYLPTFVAFDDRARQIREIADELADLLVDLDRIFPRGSRGRRPVKQESVPSEGTQDRKI